jgi:hypothetical protein
MARRIAGDEGSLICRQYVALLWPGRMSFCAFSGGG